jgi:tRNA (guanosine-2'-O-)-methyltransferase
LILKNYIEFLESFLTEKRKKILREQFESRTNYVTIVSDNLSQSFNLSAILRSLDGFGFLDIHLIENQNRFSISKDIAVGAQKWIAQHRYQSQKNCFLNLKEQGYQILATAPPSPISHSLDDWCLTQPTAFVLGQELFGLSEEFQKCCDGVIHIPMYGFVESFNVSVTAALLLQKARQQLTNSSLKLGNSEAIYENWLEQHFKNASLYRKRFLRDQKKFNKQV